MNTPKTIKITLESGEELELPALQHNNEGLKFEKCFTADKLHYNEIQWVKRDIVLTDWKTGKVIFDRKDVEVPMFWQDNAIRIAADKYLFGSNPDSIEFENSFKDLFNRVANTYTLWAWQSSYITDLESLVIFNSEIKHMLAFQIWAPNSPVWFNIGHWEQHKWGRPNLQELYKGSGNKMYHAVMEGEDVVVKGNESMYSNPQCSACFLTELKDDMDSILAHTSTEGKIFSAGSGIGVNLSKIRSSKEPIKGKGKSSGPISFDRGWDKMAGAVKSGGKTRRAARMVLMNSDHPDIFDFVETKDKQENIAKVILQEHNNIVAIKNYVHSKYGSSSAPEDKMLVDIVNSMPIVPDVGIFDNHMDALLYGETLSNQNANHSVSLTEDFWNAYFEGRDTCTKWVTDPSKKDYYDPNKLLDKIVDSIYNNGEPGIHNNDIINAWNPVASKGQIDTSNPCVTGDTLVTTSEGLLPIVVLAGREDVKVLTKENTFETATKIWKTGTKHTYLLTTKEGYSIKLTEDHKVWTENRGYVEAKDLTEEDKLLLVSADYNSTGEDDIFRLVGYSLGNGCIDQAHSALYIAASKEDEYYLDELNNIADGYIGNSRRLVKQTKTGVKLAIGVKSFLDLVSSYAVLDKYSEGKQINIKNIPSDKLASIVGGYFDADGTIANYSDKSQYIAFDSVSLTLLQQVQTVLYSLGIKSKLYYNRKKTLTSVLPDGKGGNKEYETQPIHSLRVSRDSKAKFAAIIPINNTIKKAKLDAMLNSKTSYKDSNTVTFKSLTYLGEEDVYDLTEPVTSSFVANGIAVHNCSEYVFLNNTSCNLSSFNVYRFFKRTESGEFEFQGANLIYATRIAMVCADLNIEYGGFATPEIAKGTMEYRTTGIGFANLGGTLMALGIPYDSPKARYLSAQLCRLLTGACWEASVEMGNLLGSYPMYKDTADDTILCIRKHNHEGDVLDYLLDEAAGVTNTPRLMDSMDTALMNSIGECHFNDLPIIHAVSNTAKTVWKDAMANLCNSKSIRNAFVTVMAPTGTISSVLGCYDEGTTSIEPDYSLVKYKQLSGGGMLRMFNTLAVEALVSLGYDSKDIYNIALYVAGITAVHAAHAKLLKYANRITQLKLNNEYNDILNALLSEANMACVKDYYEESLKQPGSELAIKGLGHGTLVGCPLLKQEHLSVFDCAVAATPEDSYISPMGHIKMLGAIQPFISGACSKTVNLPATITKEEIKEAIVTSRKLCIKCIALYRENSKANAVFTNYGADDSEAVNKIEALRSNIISNLKTAEDKTAIKKLPARRLSQTVKFSVGGQLSGYITVSMYPDGRCGEVFGRLGQVGSFASGMFEAFCKLLSGTLQSGIPLENVLANFRNYAFEPSGFCNVGDSTDVRSCSSVVDLLAKTLSWLFPEENNYKMIDVDHNKNVPEGVEIVRNNFTSTSKSNTLNSAAICPQCNSLSYVQDGKCKSCRSCGFKNGGCGE